jgi:hypothetical protein
LLNDVVDAPAIETDRAKAAIAIPSGSKRRVLTRMTSPLQIGNQQRTPPLRVEDPNRFGPQGDGAEDCEKPALMDD